MADIERKFLKNTAPFNSNKHIYGDHAYIKKFLAKYQ